MSDLNEKLVPPSILIVNNGRELVETNYWQTANAARGFFYLTTNAGCTRLLVPSGQTHHLLDMTRGVREVVLTRGRFETTDDMVEVLFEDGSPSPYCLHIDPKQVDRKWLPADEGKRWRFAIYTTEGRVAEFSRCFMRRAPRLPYAQPWRGK